MRKFFLIFLLLPFIASCSLLGGTPNDFKSLYQAHVHSQISTMREIAEDLGYMQSYRIDGALRGALSLPSIFSGSLSAEYSAESNHGDATNHLKNIALDYTMFGASGAVRAKSVDIVTKIGDFFVRYSGLDGGDIMAPEVLAITKKYENTWLSVSQSELMGETNGESQTQNQIAQALSRMSLDDVEKYLTDYPLWKEEKDLGETNGFHSYSVTLARESIIAIVEDFTKKATGKPLEEKDRTSLTEELAKIEMKGTLSFDPRERKRAQWDMVLTDSTNTGNTLKIAGKQDRDNLEISLGNEVGSMNLAYKGGSEVNSLVTTVKDTRSEIGKLDLKFTKKIGHIVRIDGTLLIPGEGMTVTLEHVVSDDHSFAGKLNAGIGNLTWKGKIDGSSLGELLITGAMPGSSLNLDLKKSGDMLTGPLSVKNGDTSVIEAKVGLRVEKERFSLALDIADPETPSYQTHAEIDLTGKRTKWDGTIDTPSPTKPLSEMTKEIDELNPTRDMSGIELDTGAITPLPQNTSQKR